MDSSIPDSRMVPDRLMAIRGVLGVMSADFKAASADEWNQHYHAKSRRVYDHGVVPDSYTNAVDTLCRASLAA